MENTVKNTERSRIGSVSEVGAINDGNLLGSRKDLNKTYLKMPQKSSAEKKEKKKSRSKYYDEQTDQFKCPSCGQLFELCDDVSKHVWYEHKHKVENATKKASQNTSTVKKAKKGKPKKWHPNADGRYECPFCGKSYKNVHSASCHIWTDHKQGKKKSKEKGDAIHSITFESLSSGSVWEWLKILPIEFVQTMDPDKLKELILEKRKEEENKQNVAKS